MSEELKNGCSPSDCASCSGCGDSIPRNITLTLDDDTEVECAILTVFPVEDKGIHRPPFPLDETARTRAERFSCTHFPTATGDPMLANIEDDVEYQTAAEAFDLVLKMPAPQRKPANPH